MAKKRASESSSEKAGVSDSVVHTADDRSAAAIARVRETITWFKGDSIGRMATLIRRVTSVHAARELLEELDAMEQAVAEEARASGERYLTQGVRAGLVYRFLARFIDGSASFPATFYGDQFGIKSSTLRQAARRGKIATSKNGSTVLYPFAEVRALWPHLVTYDWAEVSSAAGVTKRDKA